MSGQLQLHVLIFQERDTWVAQALEKDMAAHGPTPYAALAAVEQVLQAHVNFDTRYQRQPLSRLNRAPEVYWKAFESAEPLQPPTLQLMHPAIIEAAISKDPVNHDC